jgi:uncharacterized protein YbjT (DUF2867 family)
MKTALVLGGTGLTGKKIIRLLLADKRYSHVKVPVRTKMDIIYDKLDQINFDYDNPTEDTLQADEVFCCLGTTIKNAGSNAAFYKVDYEYVLNCATIAKKLGAQKFILISAVGANIKSNIIYNKTKGQIEAALTAIGFNTLIILRPSLLLGKRKEYRMAENIASFFMTTFSFLIPAKYKAIESREVALAMLYLINNTDLTGVHIIENTDIKKAAIQYPIV